MCERNFRETEPLRHQKILCVRIHTCSGSPSEGEEKKIKIKEEWGERNLTLELYEHLT